MKTEREQKLEWLSRGRPLRLKLIGLYAERRERISRAEYAGISYDGMRGQSSGNGTERKLAAIEEIDEEISAAESELSQVEGEIREEIERIRQPIYQAYLRMRFLGYTPERKIAEETGYAMSYIGSVVRKKSIDAVKIPANTR